MNIYSFTGRLGRDCETRFTQAGMAICSFTVAVDYGFGENKGTNWIRCSLFGKRAEGGLPKYLVKGTQVAISGELKVREYDDKDGNKRTSVDVSVDKLDLIGGRGEAQSGGGGDFGGSHSSGGSRSSGGSQKSSDPFADSPDFGDVPVDDDIPF
ncbi:MAG: single-stranded DNA-binding protein [Mariprofundaceae bacterium]|nr:single-stranded DNA-binding protein [Mariprofundaceae bacterium]